MEFLRQFARLFGYRNRQIESLREYNTYGFRIRVWRSTTSMLGAESSAESADVLAALEAFTSETNPPSIYDIAGALSELPRVSCVAITHGIGGNGVSIYPDWH